MSDTTRNVYNVLFLCTGNSARSILAESIVGRWAPGRFRGYSAGSHPQGTVNPHAISLLREMNYKTDHLRSKSWDEFATDDAPELDFVFTVCGKAAGEVCPVWPGQPLSAHWGVPDPAAVEGDEATIRKAFLDAYLVLEARIKLFTALPVESLDRLTLKKRLDEIGQEHDSAA